MRWLRDGLIEGAVKQDPLWYIPEGARPRYKVRKKNNRKQNDNMFDFIKALDMRRYVDNVILGCSEADYQDLLRILVEADIIEESDTPYDGKWNTGYTLTARGIGLADRSKSEAIALFQTGLAGITEGVVKAYQG